MSKLGQLLVGHGWLSVQQLTRALQTQSAVGGRLGTCLLEMEVITEDNLLKGLAEQHGVPSASIDDLRGIPDEVLALIPDKLARRCRAIPFRVVGTRLDVAMMDPRNLAAQDELAFASGKRVMVYVAHELRILESLESFYREETSSRISMLIERLNRARYFWERERAAESAAASGLASLPPLPAPPPTRTPIRRAPPPQPVPAATVMPAATSQPAATVKPAPARPSIQTVSMTAEERAALSKPEQTPGPQSSATRPVPAPPPAASPASLPSPDSIEQVEAAFGKTHDREEVARIALGFLARGYRRAALFQVAKEKVSAWMAQGDLDLPIFQKFSTGFDQPSVFLNLRNGSSLYMGPLPPMPAHRELARAWGGELPKDCVLLPVRLKDRLVAVLYADGGLKASKGIGGIGGIELSQLQRLASSTGAALEQGILHRKRAEAKP